MSPEGFARAVRMLARSLFQRADDPVCGPLTAEDKRAACDLTDAINALQAPPLGIFEKSLRWEYSYQDSLLKACPKVFLGLLKRFPGRFEDIVGYTYLASPEILGAAIDAGEPVSRTLNESAETESGRAHNGRYSASALCYPIFSLVRKAESAFRHAGDSAPDNEYADKSKACLRLLAKAGASASQRATDGSTVLECLLVEGRPLGLIRELLPVLFEIGASPDLSNSRTGNTALHHAMDQYGCKGGYDIETLNAILAYPHTMDLAAKSHSGKTPLDSCWLNPRLTPEAVRAYLHRAELQDGERSRSQIFPPYDSRPPLLYMLARAEHPQFEEIADLLLAHGASIQKPLKPPRIHSYLENDYLKTVHSIAPLPKDRLRICDFIIENEQGWFSERVVAYFRRKLMNENQ